VVLTRFYLRRLERFARLSERPESALAPERRLLAGRALLAAYRDCVALGLAGEARDVLARVIGRRVPSV
jgi:hypothetical protein